MLLWCKAPLCNFQIWFKNFHIWSGTICFKWSAVQTQTAPEETSRCLMKLMLYMGFPSFISQGVFPVQCNNLKISKTWMFVSCDLKQINKSTHSILMNALHTIQYPVYSLKKKIICGCRNCCYNKLEFYLFWREKSALVNETLYLFHGNVKWPKVTRISFTM